MTVKKVDVKSAVGRVISIFKKDFGDEWRGEIEYVDDIVAPAYDFLVKKFGRKELESASFDVWDYLDDVFELAMEEGQERKETPSKRRLTEIIRDEFLNNMKYYKKEFPKKWREMMSTHVKYNIYLHLRDSLDLPSRFVDTEEVNDEINRVISRLSDKYGID